MTLWLDFETKSECDLKLHGAYNYARHPTTQVLCMAYAFGDEEVRLWTPLHPFPERVANHEGQIRAHNAAFERLIFQHVLGLDFKLEQYYCTATQARANCAPGGLEDAGRPQGRGAGARLLHTALRRVTREAAGAVRVLHAGRARHARDQPVYEGSHR
jgi:DNA polymerase